MSTGTGVSATELIRHGRDIHKPFRRAWFLVAPPLGQIMRSPGVRAGRLGTDIHSVPATSASDKPAFRQFRQFLASLKRSGISYNKNFRFYRQYFGYIGHTKGASKRKVELLRDHDIEKKKTEAGRRRSGLLSFEFLPNNHTITISPSQIGCVISFQFGLESSTHCR